MGCGKYHGKYNEREDGKILAYKRNKKPLLNFPTTKALQDFSRNNYKKVYRS